jgi:hypothetical protein
MSQHDLNIANQGFPAFRADLNNALAALGTLSSGATEPSTTYANQLWYDTANDQIKIRNEDDDAWITILTLNQTTDAVSSFSGLVIGTDVQAYDADTAKTDTAQTFTASQRGTVTTDNDLSFDMNVTNFFKCTPAANGTLTFTNITAGQSGNIWLDNSGGYTISAAASTYIASADLTTISTAGVYFLSYYSDGTNVMVSATPAVTSAGA